WCQELLVEIRIQDRYFGNLIDRQVVFAGHLPDGFRGRRIIDAKGLCFVLADIGVDPGDQLFRIVGNHRAADLGSRLVHGNGKGIGKSAFHEIAWHGFLLWLCSGRGPSPSIPPKDTWTWIFLSSGGCPMLSTISPYFGEGSRPRLE